MTTHWSLVLAAAAREESPDGRQALETLCERYWHPLYAFVRRRGYSPEDAQDLTQAFFARLLDKGDVARASPARGRFRSFLLAALKNFLLNEYDRLHALKRGGGATLVPIDAAPGDRHPGLDPPARETPEDEFNRQWALAVLDRGLQQTRTDYTTRGQSALFARLSELITPGTRDDSYAAAAAELGMSDGAVKVAVHRMRRRFRHHLRTEIAQTVDDGEVDDEIRFLMRVIGRGGSQA